MIACPACGHEIEDSDLADLDVDDEVECSNCERSWTLVSLDPIELAPAESEASPSA